MHSMIETESKTETTSRSSIHEWSGSKASIAEDEKSETGKSEELNFDRIQNFQSLSYKEQGKISLSAQPTDSKLH
jgi:hypothetical protein